MRVNMKIEVGDKIPDVNFQSTDDCISTFNSLEGQNIVLYFYPKDNTPGCTLESQHFRDLHKSFLKVNTEVIGISRDSISSHQKFSDKHNLSFTLISDQNEAICRAFGVLVEKNMYGRKAWGIERSTFLIDAKGIVRQIWRKVKVDGHADEVLAAAEKL